MRKKKKISKRIRAEWQCQSCGYWVEKALTLSLDKCPTCGEERGFPVLDKCRKKR